MISHSTLDQNNMNNRNELLQSSEMELMDVSDWIKYLQENPDHCLIIEDLRGTHTVEFDSHDDQVTFYAHGSQRYDHDGTQAVLETIAGTSDGMRVLNRDML